MPISKPMMIRKNLLVILAIVLFGTTWCVLAASEDDVVEIIQAEAKFSECPGAVQQTIQVESVGAELGDVTKTTEDDRSGLAHRPDDGRP